MLPPSDITSRGTPHAAGQMGMPASRVSDPLAGCCWPVPMVSAYAIGQPPAIGTAALIVYSDTTGC